MANIWLVHKERNYIIWHSTACAMPDQQIKYMQRRAKARSVLDESAKFRNYRSLYTLVILKRSYCCLLNYHVYSEWLTTFIRKTHTFHHNRPSLPPFHVQRWKTWEGLGTRLYLYICLWHNIALQPYLHVTFLEEILYRRNTDGK